MKKFHEQTLAERHANLIDSGVLTSEQTATLLTEALLDHAIADGMIENQIGQFPLPLGVAMHFMIDGTPYYIPMVTEEPSVIAASSNAAKIVKQNGGFMTTVHERAMIGQLIFTDITDFEAALALIHERETELFEIANNAHPSLVKRGGGLKRIETRIVTDEDSNKTYLTLHLVIDVQEAMGANMINTILEATSIVLKDWLNSEILMRILSNFADTSLVSASCVIKPTTLTTKGFDGNWLAQRIVEATRYAQLDPYRATTHNKGIMNGVDAVVLASGNDTRAIEAGTHAFAVKQGRYQPLSKWTMADNGDLLGTITLPLPVGAVGGATHLLPMARVAHDLLNKPSATELARIIAAVGLAQNLAALKALVSDGIQKGHMSLQAKSLALSAGATEDELLAVTTALIASNHFNLANAKMIISQLRNTKN